MKTTIRKAVGAAIGAGAAALGTAMLDGNLTGPEALIAAGGALIAGAAVWKLAYQVPVE
jgi:hypothetical protein